jgi:hypothetical protein
VFTRVDTGPYPEPDESNPLTHTHPVYLRSNLIFSHILVGFTSYLFPLDSPTNILYARLTSPMRAHSYHLINFVAVIIFGDEFKSRSSSLRSFLQPPVPSIFRPSKYSPRYPFLRHPESVLFLQVDRPRFTPIKITGKIIVLYVLTICPAQRSRT